MGTGGPVKGLNRETGPLVLKTMSLRGERCGPATVRGRLAAVIHSKRCLIKGLKEGILWGRSGNSKEPKPGYLTVPEH